MESSEGESPKVKVKSSDMIKSIDLFDPYRKAIENLKGIIFLKSPLHKLKNLIRTAELIH